MPLPAGPRRSGAADLNGLLPDTELPAHRDQLADVVRRVIRRKQNFAQVGLTRTVRNRRQQIDLRIRGETLKSFPIAPVAGERLVPGRTAAGCRRGRPVFVRPLLLFVLGGLTELEDVGLRD